MKKSVFPFKTIFFSLVFFVFSNLNAQDSLSLPSAAPEFELLSSAGKKVKLSDYRDSKYVLVEFFATWCPTCIGEMKYMNDIYPDLKENVEFISISLDREIDAFIAFNKKKKNYHEWPVLYGGLGSDIQKAYNVREFPTFFLIDKSGNIMPLDYQFASDGIEELLKTLK